MGYWSDVDIDLQEFVRMTAPVDDRESLLRMRGGYDALNARITGFLPSFHYDARPDDRLISQVIA